MSRGWERPDVSVIAPLPSPPLLLMQSSYTKGSTDYTLCTLFMSTSSIVFMISSIQSCILKGWIYTVHVHWVDTSCALEYS